MMMFATTAILLQQVGVEQRMQAIAMGLVLLTVMGVWLLVIIQAAINPAFSPAERILWVMIIIGMGCIGALLYFVAAAKREPEETGPG